MRMKLRREPCEEGATMVLVAVTMIVFFGMLALAIDIGGALAERRQMVTASDSASLAAAQTCAEEEPESEATSQANSYATQNESGASQVGISYGTGGCEANPGSVTVEYESQYTFSLAHLVLGQEATQDVSFESTAIWGPALGSENVMPMGVSLNGDGVVACVVNEEDHTCGYTFNNDDFGTEFWGTADIGDGWGVSENGNCPPGASASELAEWIEEGIKLQLTANPTFVCIDNGHQATFWADALQDIVDADVFVDVPVNDPDLMPTGGDEKFAIVGFMRMKVEEIVDDEEEAWGTAGIPAASGHCDEDKADLVKDADYDLDVQIPLPKANPPACTGGNSPDAITNLVISNKVGNNTTTYQLGTDYTYNTTTRTIHWLANNVNDADVNFDWSKAGTAGTAGVCGSGGMTGDGNAICVVFSWPGTLTGGFDPCEVDCSDLEGALEAIRLKK